MARPVGVGNYIRQYILKAAHEGLALPKNTAIADVLGCGEHSVRRVMNAMQDADEIVVRRCGMARVVSVNEKAPAGMPGPNQET